VSRDKRHTHFVKQRQILLSNHKVFNIVYLYCNLAVEVDKLVQYDLFYDNLIICEHRYGQYKKLLSNTPHF